MFNEEPCSQCGLYRYSKCPKVVGRGNSHDPRLLLIGEAPGPDEAEKGIAFIGRAGKLLDEMLSKSLTDPSALIFITNMVKCFPPLSVTEPKKGFRIPKTSEVDYCSKFLIQELELFVTKPIIVTLGNTALKGLTNSQEGITKVLGKPHEVLFNDESYTIFPNYHPSYILRNGGKGEEDFVKVIHKAYLAYLDKEEGYEIRH